MSKLVRRAAFAVGVACWLFAPPAAKSATPQEATGLPGAATEPEHEQRAHSDQLYRAAQREIQRQDYASALTLLREYLDYTRSAAHRPERVFWVIDQVGRIYLSEKRDADGALAFFTEIRGDARLSELDRSAIDEWISVATEWRETRKEVATGLRDPAPLFERGTRYFKSGSKKLEMTGVVSLANADFNVAAGYLRRFAILYDRHPRIGEVLSMLGAIRHYSNRDQEYWTDNYYLNEAIRRFPHTDLAARSFKLLRQEAVSAYAPKEIPTDLAERLQDYEELATPGAPAPPQAP